LYPHEVSGGMGQRVMIAMMLVPEPDLLIADEPTSALDVTVQAQLLELIDELIQRRGMALLLISHNLNLVAAFCDRVMVMYAGRVLRGRVRGGVGRRGEGARPPRGAPPRPPCLHPRPARLPAGDRRGARGARGAAARPALAYRGGAGGSSRVIEGA